MTPRNIEVSSKKGLRNVMMSVRDPFISILVIDDDLDYLGLLSAELEQIEDVRVCNAINSETATELLLHEHFDLIVCDWALASTTAAEVFLSADSRMFSNPTLASGQKTPVMFMSGSEKVGATQKLNSLKNFEAVSFIIKRLGPPMISVMAKNILHHIYSPQGQDRCVYLS